MHCFAGVFKTYFSGIIIFIAFDLSNADSEEGDLLLQSNMNKYGRAGPAGRSTARLKRVVYLVCI